MRIGILQFNVVRFNIAVGEGNQRRWATLVIPCRWKFVPAAMQMSVSSGIESGSESFACFRAVNIAAFSTKAFARNDRQ